MYSIKRESFGYRLVFGGFIKGDEMKQWVEESRKALAAAPSSFGVVIDMRDLKPLPADAQAAMQDGQKLFKQSGMARSAVILSSAALVLQFKRIAKQTGIYDFERYLDASETKDWEPSAIAWVKDSVDPDRAS